MERRKPACRGGWYGTDHSCEPHGPHDYFWDKWAGTTPCGGWSEQEAGATALADRLDQVARGAWPGPLPLGTRLECHASVAAVLRQLYIPTFSEFTASLATGQDLTAPQMPVVITRDLADGQWRITADIGLTAEGTITL